jgi:hypothetical protein
MMTNETRRPPYTDEDVAVVAEAMLTRDGRLPPRTENRGMARRVLDALAATGRWVRVDPEEPHLVEFRESGWTIQHPPRCRPNLFNCQVNRVAERTIAGSPAGGTGIYECRVRDDGVLVIGERREERGNVGQE